MNERIKQLLLQVAPRAGEDGEYLPSLHTAEDIERFAQLIVRECAKVIDRGDGEMCSMDETIWCNACRDDILKHFGVE